MNILVLMGAPQNKEDHIMSDLKEIHRTTILEHSFNTLKNIEHSHFIFVVRKEDVHKWHIDNIIKLLEPKADVIVTNGSTRGAVCTAMLAIDRISNGSPLVVTGGNQIVLESLQEIVQDFISRDLDAGTIVFKDIHPRWSYVRLDREGRLVIEAAEKKPISRNASTGFYYYKHGRDFISAAERMILKDTNVNGLYYLSLCLNELILEQKRIGVYSIPKERYYNLNHKEGIGAFEKYLESRERDGFVWRDNQ